MRIPNRAWDETPRVEGRGEGSSSESLRYSPVSCSVQAPQTDEVVTGTQRHREVYGVHKGAIRQVAARMGCTLTLRNGRRSKSD
jgi:hypothetical protein